MQFLQRLIENFIKEHVRRKRLYRVVSVLACIVVFVTTYAMILPAITLDRATAEEQPGIETEAGSDPALSGEVNDGTDAEDPEPAEPQGSDEKSRGGQGRFKERDLQKLGGSISPKSAFMRPKK